MKSKIVITMFSLFLLLGNNIVRAGIVFSENENEKENKIAIKGVVLDEENAPLAGAIVSLSNTMVATGTNSRGEFILKVKQHSQYKIKASYIGYETVEVISTGKDKVTIKLKPLKNQLDEVVVTGARDEKPLKDLPVITRVVSRKRIEQLNPMDIESLLQYEIPGLQFKYQAMSQQPKISYQGMEGKHILFLIDGERISGEGADGNIDFTRINIDQIERIEIVKGAQSTLYGSNALGAVINIITRSADRPINAGIDLRYGNNSGQKYTGFVGVKKDNLSNYTTISHRNKKSYVISDKNNPQIRKRIDINTGVVTEEEERGDVRVRGYSTWDFSNKTGYAFNEKLSSELKLTYYNNSRNQNTAIDKVRDIYQDFAANGKLKYTIDDNNKLEFSTIFDRYSKDKKYVELPKTDRVYDNKQYMSRISYNGNIKEKHNIAAGLEFNYESLKHYMFKDNGSNSVRYYVAYIQDSWKISDKFDLVAGVRADIHSKYALHVTPKLSAMYRPLKELSLRFGYANGFKSPTLKELYMDYDMGGLGIFYIYGNQDLKPETSTQYSISAEYNKGRFYGAVSTQYNRFKNKIEYGKHDVVRKSGYNDLIYVNKENSKSLAFEAIGKVKTDIGLTFQASYSFVTEYQYYKGYNTSNTRPHSITFNVLYNKKYKHVNVSSALNGQWFSKLTTYAQENSGNRLVEYNLPSRLMCSLNTKFGFKRGISLSLGAENLLNYVDSASNYYNQVPELGIGFMASLSINLSDFFKW